MLRIKVEVQSDPVYKLVTVVSAAEKVDVLMKQISFEFGQLFPKAAPLHCFLMKDADGYYMPQGAVISGIFTLYV